MKRRNVLIGMSLLAGGALVGYPGFKWLRWHTEPDLDYLAQSRDLLAAVADTIIPRTDSPGASDCGVPEFIIKMIKECTDLITQNKFLDGLHGLESFSQSKFDKSFLLCSPAERSLVLQHVEANDKPWPGLAGKVQKRYLGSPFFVTLKHYTVIGYCTSEGGATQGLRYSHVPSQYVACAPYASGEKAWATI